MWCEHMLNSPQVHFASKEEKHPSKYWALDRDVAVEVFLGECADVAFHSVVSTRRINVLMEGWFQGENPEGMAVTSGGIAWWAWGRLLHMVLFQLSPLLENFHNKMLGEKIVRVWWMGLPEEEAGIVLIMKLYFQIKIRRLLEI